MDSGHRKVYVFLKYKILTREGLRSRTPVQAFLLPPALSDQLGKLCGQPLSPALLGSTTPPPVPSPLLIIPSLGITFSFSLPTSLHFQPPVFSPLPETLPFCSPWAGATGLECLR